jgi:uncharacterized protein
MSQEKNKGNGAGSDSAGDEFTPMVSDVASQLREDIDASGGAWTEPEEYRGSIGRTMYDMPSSSDGTITVLTPE